jgi:hypothetical protein
MAKSFETSASSKKGFLEFWKKFNKVSAIVLVSAGVVLENPALLGLAGVDVAQNFVINRVQEGRSKRKASKGLGKVALANS